MLMYEKKTEYLNKQLNIAEYSKKKIIETSLTNYEYH